MTLGSLQLDRCLLKQKLPQEIDTYATRHRGQSRPFDVINEISIDHARRIELGHIQICTLLGLLGHMVQWVKIGTVTNMTMNY